MAATAPEMLQFSVAELERIVHTMKETKTAFVTLEEIQRMKNTFPLNFLRGGGEKIGPFTTLPSDSSSEPVFTNTVPTVSTVPTFRFDAGVDFNINKSNRSRKTGHTSSIKTGDNFTVTTGGETSSIGNGTSLFGQNQNFNPNNINVSSSMAFAAASGSNSDTGGGWFWGGAAGTNNETATASNTTTFLRTNNAMNGVNHFADATNVMSRTPVAADSSRPMDGANFTNGSDLHGSGLHSDEGNFSSPWSAMSVDSVSPMKETTTMEGTTSTQPAQPPISFTFSIGSRTTQGGHKRGGVKGKPVFNATSPDRKKQPASLNEHHPNNHVPTESDSASAEIPEDIREWIERKKQGQGPGKNQVHGKRLQGLGELEDDDDDDDDDELFERDNYEVDPLDNNGDVRTANGAFLNSLYESMAGQEEFELPSDDDDDDDDDGGDDDMNRDMEGEIDRGEYGEDGVVDDAEELDDDLDDVHADNPVPDNVGDGSGGSIGNESGGSGSKSSGGSGSWVQVDVPPTEPFQFKSFSPNRENNETPPAFTMPAMSMLMSPTPPEMPTDPFNPLSADPIHFVVGAASFSNSSTTPTKMGKAASGPHKKLSPGGHRVHTHGRLSSQSMHRRSSVGGSQSTTRASTSSATIDITMSGNKDEDSSPNMGSTNASPANSEKMVMSPLPTSTATVERRGELRREQGLGLGVGDDTLRGTYPLDNDAPQRTSNNATLKSSTVKNKSGSDAKDGMDSLAEAYRKEGNNLYKLNEFGRALDAFEKALNFAPTNPPWPTRPQVLGNRAASLMMLHRYIESADDCAEALTLDPTMIKLHTRRGRALLRLGHFTAADEAFHRVLEIPTTSSQGGLNDVGSSGEEKELEAAKTDARNGLKALAGARSSMKRLGQLENAGDYHGVLMLVTDLQLHCPACSLVHVSRCAALCKLKKWGEAKTAVEDFLCTAHVSIQKLEAHPAALLPAPDADSLAWVEKPGKSIVTVDTQAVVNALLCMGPRLSEVYLQALKNIDATRNCSADVMSRVLVIISELSQILKAHQAVHATDGTNNNKGLEQLLVPWIWVTHELQRTKELIEWKNIGDRQFRASSHADAINSYSKAIKADPEAVRWAAILYNNRAAAHTALGQLADAIADCHQALNRDDGYARAYLRRARALLKTNTYAAAVRDFRRYLSSEPPPNDTNAVMQELEAAMEANRKQMRGEQQRHEWEQRTEESRKTWGSGNGSSSSSSSQFHPGMFPSSSSGSSGPTRSQPSASSRMPGSASSPSSSASSSRFASGFPMPKNNNRPGTQTKFNNSWNSDDEEKFNFYSSHQNNPQQPHSPSHRQYHSFHPAGRGASTARAGGGVRQNNYSFVDDSEDDDDAGPPPSSYSRYASGASSSTGTTGTSKTSTGGNNNHTKATTGGIGMAGDHYQTLGLDTTSSERQIKMAYRKLALQFHPDKNKDPTAEEKFKIITGAYSVLVDKSTRDQYDRTRPGGFRFTRW